MGSTSRVSITEPNISTIGKNGMLLNRSTKRIRAVSTAPTKIPGDATDNDADDDLNEDNHKTYHQRYPSTVHESGQLHPSRCYPVQEDALRGSSSKC